MAEPTEEEKAAAAAKAAADAATADAAKAAADKAAADKAADEALGDAGRRAIAAERESAAAARREAAAAKAELEELRKAGMSDQEKALATARAEGEAAAMAKTNERVLLSDLRSAATGMLADPTDAARLLDLSKFTVGADGTFDQAAMKAAIADLVKTKPYLAAGATSAGAGSGDQGASGGAPGLITRDQLKTMSTAEIEAARVAGKLDHLLKT